METFRRSLPLLLLLSPGLLFLPACSGGAKEKGKKGRPPVRTRADLERRLSEAGTAPLEDSSFAGSTLVSPGGRRFRYDTPFTDEGTYEEVKGYYEGPFRSALLEAGFLESPLSTPLKRIYTNKGETLMVQVALPSTAATSGKLATYITYRADS